MLPTVWISVALTPGSAPSISGLAFALPIAVIAFTGLEAAASLAAEVKVSPQELRRLIGPGSFVIVLVYVGISIVGIGALPVHHGVSASTPWRSSPRRG